MMLLKCLLCELGEIHGRSRLIKHLTGQPKWGGHALCVDDANEQADKAEREVAAAAKSLSAEEIWREFESGVKDANGVFLGRLMCAIAANARLPRYEVERRVDTMVFQFLPAILEEILNWGGVELIVPEFPVQKREHEGTKLHDCVDGLLYRKTPTESWVLCELKTDKKGAEGKASKEQLKHRLELVQKKNAIMRSLLETAMMVGRTKKYKDLRNIIRACEYPWDRRYELLYITPKGITVEGAQSPPDRFTQITFEQMRDVKLREWGQPWRLFRDTVVRAIVSGYGL